MNYSANEIERLAREDEKLNRKLINAFKKKPPRDLDDFVQNAHERAFEKIDCLDCANCCRSLGPRITNVDIERLSKYLKIKPVVLIQTHLRVDEDGDFVFKQMPCPFLDSDNSCRVYEQRPKACRDYPHTDRKKIHQVLDLTLKNTFVCPAVIEIMNDLRLWKSQDKNF